MNCAASACRGRTEFVRLHHAYQIDAETLHDLERDLDLEELGAIAGKAEAADVQSRKTAGEGGVAEP